MGENEGTKTVVMPAMPDAPKPLISSAGGTAQPPAAAAAAIPQTDMSRAPSPEMVALMNIVIQMREDAAKDRAERAILEKQVSDLQSKQVQAMGGGIPIIHMHCNNCGWTSEKGEKCPRHPHDQINHVGRVMEPHTNRIVQMVVRTS